MHLHVHVLSSRFVVDCPCLSSCYAMLLSIIKSVLFTNNCMQRYIDILLQSWQQEGANPDQKAPIRRPGSTPFS